jgi:hypothetical protein
LGTIQSSTGVHDDLFGRALVLHDGKQRIAFLSLDLIGLDFVLSDEIRHAIRKRTGIAAVLVHCTHNHSAPFTIPWSVLGPRWLAGPGRAWRDTLAAKLAELVFQADAKRVAVTLSAGRAPVRIGTNRRMPDGQTVVMKPNKDGPVVPWVDVLRVDRMNGTPLAILFSHAAHPVIIHGSSRLISAEFPGFAAGKLKEWFGGDVVPLFGQAFAANINGDPLRGGMEAAQRAGNVLAEAVVQAASKGEPIPAAPFTLTSVHAGLPLQALPNDKEVAAAIHEEEDRLRKLCGQTEFSDQQLWHMQDAVECARSQEESAAVDDTQPMAEKPWWIMDTILCLRDLLRKIHAKDERPLRFEAHLLRIGDGWSLLVATHELFAEYQLALDEAVPTAHRMMLAYTNGCESYVPMDRDLALGGYEAATFPDLDGASLRYRHRRALQLGVEKQVVEQLRSLWS